jgi:hypothetical protein
MIRIIISILVLIPILGFSQNNFIAEYSQAENLLNSNKIDSAYLAFKKLENTIDKNMP